VATRLEARDRRVLYETGEESAAQLRLSAARLEEEAGAVHVVADTQVETIMGAAREIRAEIVVIDSIQTVGADGVESSPGSVSQVRESAATLMRFAKEENVTVVVVGHVTKGGGIAGPKTLEHIVDTVLYFEGEGSLDHRLLRATKNRFGSVDELGVFAMTGQGLVPVPDPSAVFLAARAEGTSGTAVTALMEGTRPMLVEVQALTAPAGYGTPQRVVTGLDPKRLAVLLAVLDRRAGIGLGSHDVFVQISAGVRVSEPAADLAVIAALISSLRQVPTPADGLFLGEVGLGGEIRPVSGSDRRLAEAAQHGFRRCFTSARATSGLPAMTTVGLERIDQLEPAINA
jgi:DNA repair protein RadA/Sms